MQKMFGYILAAVMAVGAGAVCAAPPDESKMVPWQIPFTSDLGVMSAAGVLDTPAGREGSIVARDGHFFTAGGQRIRFWGVNTCFAGDFPTHEQADQIAPRLASLGVNCVRLHHMDMMKFPSGIFADDKLETLSPEALDRLDYFIAALKKHGVYVDVNLHVSRKWSQTHKMPNANQLDMDKLADLFYPEFIAAQKQYARDLLTHVNKYTGNKYAEEPAVAMIEINNENTLFLWGGDKRIEELPEPYGPYLTKLWNEWLVKKYTIRDKLATAWNVGAENLGESQISAKDRVFADLNKPGSHWGIEGHESVSLKAEATGPGFDAHPPSAKLTIANSDTIGWHAQFSRTGLKVKKGQFYTVAFKAWADKPTSIVVAAGQTHDPWQNLGFSTDLKLGNTENRYQFGFVASSNDDTARITFQVGRQNGIVYLCDIILAEGGREGLREGEDPARNSVLRRVIGEPSSQSRQVDWFDFLQQLDESYFVSMREFLKKDLGAKSPITGTTGLGALGTLSQSKMDFVDAHSYWDHPQFPRRGWDAKDWLINNKPMVDNPAGATLWGLAATRVAGKAFTVTEYNHSAPNEWQAECVPMIASFAAAQDWDAVFLFAYSHNANYDKGKMDSFFDIEGNTLKLAHMATAARLFLMPKAGPLAMPLLDQSSVLMVERAESLRLAPRYYFQLWDQIRDRLPAAGDGPHQSLLHKRLALTFDGTEAVKADLAGDTKLAWTAASKRYTAAGSGAAVFVGATGEKPVDFGPLRIESSAMPFLTLILVSADGSTPLDKAKSMLLSVAARGSNEGTKWDAARRSVSDQWGKGPMHVETVDATLSLPGGPVHVYTLDVNGKRGKELPVRHEADRQLFSLAGAGTLWFEITR